MPDTVRPRKRIHETLRSDVDVQHAEPVHDPCRRWPLRLSGTTPGRLYRSAVAGDVNACEDDYAVERTRHVSAPRLLREAAAPEWLKGRVPAL